MSTQSHSVVIGKSGGKNVAFDLDVLLATRLLVQANSGGGKSWLLRRLAEQLFGKVPVVIIDPEGEFATLREKYDYFLIGQGGDAPADVRSAGLLAETLLKLRACAVCDLFESFRKNPLGRHLWVKAFLEGILDAPKSLRRPFVLIIDEAHIFCPEKGESPAAGAMIGISTAGRKRGVCPVWATQRLALLDKSASSQLQNRMVGLTFEDVDVTRAVELLSVSAEDKHKFKQQVKTLEPGQFFAFGRAITKERLLVNVGPVETSIPKIGSSKYADEPPPPPAKIRALLPQLADLPKTAEEKARTEAEFKKEIRELQRQLRTQTPATVTKTQLEKMYVTRRITEADVASILKPLVDQHHAKLMKSFEDWQVRAIEAMKKSPKPVLLDWQYIIRQATADLNKGKDSGGEIQKGREVEGRQVPLATQAPQSKAHNEVNPLPNANSDGIKLKAGARQMLVVLAQSHPKIRSPRELQALIGAAGRTTSDYLGILRRAGYIVERNGHVGITDAGQGAAGDVPLAPQTTAELVSMWKSKFKAGVGKILDVLVDKYPTEIPREDLQAESGVSASRTFSDYIGVLRRAKLLDDQASGFKASESLFP
jgi:Helicase HerA, central domain